MTRLSAHIGYLYADLPLADRPAAAARDGFTAVEHPDPQILPACDLRSRLNDLGLSFSQIGSGMGAPGEKGLAALPGRDAAFRDGFQRACDYACVVGCHLVHPMAGVPLAGTDPALVADTYHSNISWALDHCAKAGLTLLVEAITLPGYALGSLDQAAALQDAFDGRLLLLFDTYHAAVLGIDPADWVSQNAVRIGHVHIADHPGRHEPGTGRIDFPPVLTALRRSGYAGAIGFEYLPSVPSSDSTRFLQDWKRSFSLTGAMT